MLICTSEVGRRVGKPASPFIPLAEHAPTDADLHLAGILDLDNIKEYHPPRDTLVANEYFAYQRDKVLERQVIGCCTQSWDARRKNSNDKGDHKLACLITGSGGGKSRHLKELAGVLKAMDWPDGYEELGARLKNALVFHITFENGTGGMVDSRVFQENATGASHRIGLRMAHQLLPEVDIKLLVDAVTSGSIALRDLHPAQLFERLAKLKGCSVADMTIILCVDAVHEASTLPYTGQVGDKGSPMRLVVSALSSLLTSGGKESNPFCFVCVSATADEAFEPLPSTGTEKEQIIPAPINPSEIFTGELVETDGRLKTVIADMDGHPRALEYLFKVFIKQSNGQGGPQSLDADCDGQTSIEIKEVRNEYWSAWSTVNDVVVDIKGKYEASIRAGEAIFEAVFLGLPVERNQLIRVGPSDVHIQEIIGGGLIRYDVTSKRLSIPFIFLFAVLRAKTEYADFFRDLYHYVDRSEKESISGHELCSAFEMQTALNWHFKTRLFEGQALPWTELHHGALFNDNKEWKKVKVEVKVATEGVVQLRSKFGDRRSKFGDRDTPSMEMIGRRKDEFVELRRRAGAGDGDSVQVAYSDLQNYVVVNGAQASAADVYAWVHLEEDSSVKICSWSIKVTPSTKRSKETYLMERKKAADEPGYFIELAYANASISADDLPDGCGFVGIDNFREYHGPFAARLIHLVDPPK